MTTAAIATVMSALRKPRCSLDVFHPCIRDGLGAKSPLDPASCGLDTATVPRDTSYPTGKTPSPAGKISPHSDESNPQRETSEAGQTGLRFQRGEPIPSSRQDDHIHIISARALRTRIESLETRCDWYERELQNLAHEATQSKSESPRAYKSSGGRDINVADVSSEPDSHTPVKMKQRQRRLVRSVGSSIDPLLSDASAKTRSRQRRALDLGISGTPKFKFDYGNGTTTRPKLVRLQDRWRRIGRQ
jgi:hypothetical protein